MQAFARAVSGMCQSSVRDYFEEVSGSVGHVSGMYQAGIRTVTGLCHGSVRIFSGGC